MQRLGGGAIQHTLRAGHSEGHRREGGLVVTTSQ